MRRLTDSGSPSRSAASTSTRRAVEAGSASQVREDRMIPPSAQHDMAGRIGATVSEVAASHSVYVSQPEAVATIIAQAAAGFANG